MRVRLIIPYFGTWPPLFPLYLDSCAKNPWLDILFFTDLPPPEALPSNIRFERISLEQLSEKFSARLNIPIDIANPYKLCDYKPAYGFLFAEHLAGFDYWAHGDIDLIYSEMETTARNLMAMAYDVISFRRDWISGSFCLYRNTRTVNEIFMDSGDYRRIFVDSRHYSFCEASFCWNQLLKKSIFDIDFPYGNMTLLVKSAARDGRIKIHFEDLALEDLPSGGLVAVDHGRINFGGREYPYYHWVTEKRLGMLTYPDWTDAPRRFFVTRHGFYREAPSESALLQLIEWWRDVRYRLRALGNGLSSRRKK